MKLIIAGFLILFGIIAMLTINNYGACWDMWLHIEYGKAMLHLLATGSTDKLQALNSNDIHLYPALLDMLGALIYYLGAPEFLSKKVLIAICWGLSIVPALLISNHFGGKRASIFSGILLFLCPVYFGHAFINPKDLPATCAILWFLWSTLTPAKASWQILFIALIAFTRPGFIFYGIFLIPCIKAWKGQEFKILGLCIALMFATIIAYPYSIIDPLTSLKAILNNTQFATSIPVFYMGEILDSKKLPWHYVLVLLVLTIPVLTISGLLGAFKRKYIKVWLWFLLPTILFIILRPNLYSGLRQLLILYPLACILAGLGWARITSRWKVLYVAFGLGGALTCLHMVLLHPYEYSYYSEILKDKSGFETDIWATGMMHAAQELNKTADPDDKVLLGLGNLAMGSTTFTKFYKYPKNVYLVPPEDLAKINEPIPAMFKYFVGTSAILGFDNVYSLSPIILKEVKTNRLIWIIRKQQ